MGEGEDGDETVGFADLVPAGPVGVVVVGKTVVCGGLGVVVEVVGPIIEPGPISGRSDKQKV